MTPALPAPQREETLIFLAGNFLFLEELAEVEGNFHDGDAKRWPGLKAVVRLPVSMHKFEPDRSV